MTKYVVLSANNTDDLRMLVEIKLMNGWLLIGGVAVNNGRFYQAMVHA